MKKMGIAVLSALVAAAFPQQALYDVVIHDGMIVDGTGNPWYRADIGITGGRIQKIGTIPPSAGRKAINASGRAVSPGFIDLHTHSDIPVLVDGTAQSAVRQGVTLDVIGESASVAPLEGVVVDEFKREQKRQYNFDVWDCRRRERESHRRQTRQGDFGTGLPTVGEGRPGLPASGSEL